jgi:2-oxoglutarate ferredoxin oxidoreductase subunit gamma
MVILGFLNALAKLVSGESMEKAIVDSVPKGAADVNLQAYRSGGEFALYVS